MGLRSWFRRFVSKVKEFCGVYNKYNDYQADAYFDDGSVMTYTGHPWGKGFEQFKKFAGQNAYVVEMNMNGSYWRS